ncbi:intracellular hyaluronan-binding protein 4-like isoform X2 [Thunnus albacares]|uniref:intracellular hyaluronan-binding protein 4-like isoform X2 n=1 Tax=Thunnus albacares TaxID=8236 RepID=UPI001CF6E0C0|nr:intracellular hyaluronan-binding protein 4-like isoform X2 [Thunnus albacares]
MSTGAWCRLFPHVRTFKKCRQTAAGVCWKFNRDIDGPSAALFCCSFAGKRLKMLPDAYGCVVANRFGNLLDDDADPFDLISEVETEKDKKKKKKKQMDDKKAKQKKPGEKESQKDRRLPIASDGVHPAPVRKQQGRAGPVNESGDGNEEAQRGMRMAGFRERRANQEEYPKEFSISNGISPEEKRGGRGPWNWGCVDEAASELMEVTPDAPVKSEEPHVPAEEENQNPATEEEDDGEMVVQVAMEMTLDEWKALQETSRPKAEFNIRKAENKIPSKAKVIHQSKHVETLKETLDDMEDEGNFLRRSVNDITSLLDINFGSLGRPTRGGRGRGARGGPTTRPERPKPIMEREDELAPDPDDPEDFPALSAGR